MTKRLLSFFLPVLVLSVVSSCKDPIENDPEGNQAPNTTIFLDTTDVGSYVSKTELTVYWTGDDPDGEVVGYLYSLDSLETWQFTTERSLTVIVPTKGKDTLITKIFVASVDNSGNGRFDASVTYLSKTIGGEYFTDTDSNGVYTAGEPFVDFGAIDPSPDGFAIKIKNTAPEAWFNAASPIPAETLPVASFILEGSDADGNSSIDRVELALNDTAGTWVVLPPKTSLITLKADFTVTSDTTSATILTGSDLKNSGIKIKNLKLDADNVLYYRLADNTNARSKIVSMPAAGSSQTWKVRKSANGGSLLVIRAHELGDGDSLKSLLKKAPGVLPGSTYSDADFFSLQNRDLSQTVASGIRLTLIKATVLSYKKVIWYGLQDPAVNLAQAVIPAFLNQGGKAIVRFGFSGAEGVLDFESLKFLPIDSVNRKYYAANGTSKDGFASTWRASRYLVKDSVATYPPQNQPDPAFFNSLPNRIGSELFLGTQYAPSYYSFVPSSQAYVLYRFDLPQSNDPWPLNKPVYKGFGTPVMVIENTSRNLIFSTAPLTFLTKIPPGETYPKTEDGRTYANPAVELFSKILSQEFERPATRR
ncbi:MAG: hypothetical protein L6Q77_05355 [Bacteroidetes bacterium]|nr:hypothetical protein [Bacteroidota bacterium]